MKKILALTSLVFALSVGATAMAADETGLQNDASGVDYTTNEAASFSTVLVQGPGASTDIVYVDQAEENGTFTTGLQLMLKPNLKDGTYKIKFGGAGQTLKEVELELTTAGGGSTDPDPTTIPMTAERTTKYGDVKNVAFEAEVTTAVNAVKFTVNDGTGNKTATIRLTNAPAEISGVYANCVVLVTGIPDDVTVTAELLNQ